MQDTLVEDMSALLNLVPLGTLIWDQDGCITFVNAASEALFGYPSGELIGQSLALLLPDDCYHYQTTQAAQDVDLCARHKHGHPLRVDVRAQQYQMHNRSAMIGFFNDATTRTQPVYAGVQRSSLALPLRDDKAVNTLEAVPSIGACDSPQQQVEAALRHQIARTQLLQDIAVAANQATTIEAALQTTVDLICACVEWPIGHALIRDETTPTQLISTTIWHLDDAERFAPFRALTETMHFVQYSLPGSVLATGQPRCISDMTTYTLSKRLSLLYNLGVQAGFAFPVLVGNDVVAVLEFFANESQAPDPALLALLANIGMQIGRVVERVRAEAALCASEERHRLIAENTADLILLMDQDDRVLYASPSFQTVLGYDPETISNSLLLERIHPDDRTHTLAAWERIVAEGTGSVVVRYRAANGSWRWIDVLATVTSQLGARYIVVVGHDVTKHRQVEEAMRAAEVRYRTLVEQLPVIIYTAALDAQSSTTYVSSQITQILGFTPEEWIADPRLWSQHLHPEDRERVMASIAMTQQSKTSMLLEYRSFTRDGRIVWLEDTSKMVCDEDGRALFMQGIVRDVTERKQAEEALRRSELQYRTLARNFPNGAVFLVDHNLRFTIADGQMLRKRMYPLALIEGKTVEEVVPADTREQYVRLYRAALGGTQIFTETMIEDRSFATYFLPVHNEQGEIFAALSMFHDITERKQSEEALRRSEQVYRALARNFPKGAVLLFDEELRYTVADGRGLAVMGLSRALIEGQTVWDVFASEVRADLAALYRLAIAGTASVHELGIRNHTYLLHTTPVTDDHDRIVAGMATFLDVTELKQAEYELREERALLARRVEERTSDLSAANAELARVARLKDEFLANMSHELRTPLNAVLGFSETLREQVYGPLNMKQDHFLQMIEESGRDLLALINDILDLAKIDAGKMDLDIEPTIVEQICHASVRMVQQAALKKQIDLQVQIDPCAEWVLSDSRRLKQVLVNLLVNAIKFTPVGGRCGLEVVIDRDRHVLHFTVWDTGIGIAPDQLKSIFQPFVQLDSQLKRQYDGTGLGLALVYRMIELHGGSVTVSSDVGVGSHFTVMLPWHREATKAPWETPTPNAPAATPQLSTNQARQSQPTILIAEDNELNITTIVDYLTGIGYHMLVARNGEEAVAFAREMQPTLILMDVQMPKMDGLEATRHIRAASQTARIPIIALTAFAMVGDRERCLAAGANAYFSKPVRLKELAAAIATYIQPPPIVAL